MFPANYFLFNKFFICFNIQGVIRNTTNFFEKLLLLTALKVDSNIYYYSFLHVLLHFFASTISFISSWVRIIISSVKNNTELVGFQEFTKFLFRRSICHKKIYDTFVFHLEANLRWTYRETEYLNSSQQFTIYYEIKKVQCL